jgi:hypothetical protein
MSSISTDRVPLVTLELPPSRRSGKLLRVRPFRSIELPRPRATPSGLFPAVPVRPEPPIGLALRLRRAVAWTVVLGTVALLAYAIWPRLAHGAATDHDPHARRPRVPWPAAR